MKTPLPERFAGWVAALLVLCATPCMSQDPLSCKLAMPSAVKTGEAIPLTFTLENRGSQSLRVLSWNTPLEGFFGKYLLITGPAGPVKYEGPLVKRGKPERDEYVVLAAGRDAAATVDLALPYRITQPGRYTVSYTGSLFDVTTQPIPRPPEKFTSMKLDCPAVEFELQAAAPRR